MSRKISTLLLSIGMFLCVGIGLAACGETCDHSSLMYLEVPTRFSGGQTYCPDCHNGDAMVELPKLTDASFYDIEVIDEDTSICTCEVLGKECTFYSTNFEFSEHYDEERIEYYTIVGYKGSSEVLNIPSEYSDARHGVLPVKTINFNAEYSGATYRQVKEINIPSSVESIFSLRGMTSLEKLVIPESVTDITNLHSLSVILSHENFSFIKPDSVYFIALFNILNITCFILT